MLIMFKWPTFLILSLIAVAFLFAGCETTKKEKTEKTEKVEPLGTHPFFKGIDGKVVPSKSSMEEEMLTSVGHSIEEHKEIEKALPVYEKLKVEKPSADKDAKSLFASSDKKIPVKLNFNGAAITDIIPVFAQMLKFNYLIDSGVTGNITISLDATIASGEIWEIFSQILKISNVYYSIDNGIVKIMPYDKISEASPDADKTEIEVGVYYLHNISAKDAIAQITPLVSKGVKPLELSKQNAILIVDTRSSISKLRTIIGQLDKPSSVNLHKAVLPCYNVSAGRVMSELGEILPVLGFPVSTDVNKPDAGAIHLTCLDRVQIIIASAASREALDELKNWVKVLDKADVGEQERVFIYNVLNGKADELTKGLSVIFSVQGSTLAVSSSGKNSSGSATDTGSSNVSSGSSLTSSSSKNNKEGGPASVFEVPVKVFADAVHNRLVIRTTPRTYAMLKAVLDRLDTMPSQVLLQVLVVEINLTEATQFGMEFAMKGGGDNVQNIFGTNYKELVPGGTGDNAQYGGKYWIFNPSNPDEKFGYIKALAGNTHVKVISSPQVLVVSHTEAKISVGNKVPLVTSEITNTQSTQTTTEESSTNLVRNIQYQDTGIILKITPHVTRGGLITIDMDQTVSEAITNTTSNIDSPEIQERILQTSMSIRNGQTIICGGLIREQIEDNLDSIPFVDQIPFLRRLVGNTNMTKRRTEMLVLITGYIITRDTKLEELLKRYHQAVDSLKDFHERTHGIKQQKPEKKNTGFWDSWLFS